MKYLRFTYVDAITGVSCHDAPCKNGPTFPNIDGLTFLFARESEYPTNRPVFYGSCPDSSDINVQGVLAVLTEDQCLAERKAEMRTQVSALFTRKLNQAFEFDFGDKIATLEDGTIERAGVRYLQCDPDSRERWNAAYVVALSFIAVGVPDEPMRPLRTEDNAIIPMTAIDIQQCILGDASTGVVGLQAEKAAMMNRMWDLKNAIVQAVDHAALDAINITEGW